MTTGKKYIARNLVWSFVILVMNAFVNMWMTPFITNNIGVDAFGFIALAETSISYLDIIAIALNSLAAKYISVELFQKNDRQASQYASSVLVANIILSFLILIPSIFIIKYLDDILKIPNNLDFDIKVLFFIVVIRYVITILTTVFNVSTFVNNRLDIASRNKGISVLIKLFFTVALLLIFTPHVWYVELAALLGLIFIVLYNIAYTKKHNPDLQFRFAFFSKNCVLEIVKSGIWNSINSLGNVLNSGLDLLVTNIYLSPISMGNLSVAKKVVSISATCLSQISNAFRPKQLEAFSQGNDEGLYRWLSIAMKVSAFFCDLIFCGFIACGKEFISLWIPSLDLSLVYNIIVLVLLGDTIVGVVQPLYYVYTVTNHLKMPCFVTIGNGLLNVLSEILLVKNTNLDLYAIVITTAVCNFVTNIVFAPLYSSYCLNIKKSTFYPTVLRHLCSCLVMSVCLIIISKKLFYANSWFFLMIKIIVLSFIGVIIGYIILFNRREKNYIRRMIVLKLKR